MKEPTHIHDWLETAVMSQDEGTRFAAFFLHHRRLSAVAQWAFRPYLGELKLFCTYAGERYRCTGASRLGDVWLAKDHAREHGYDLRVNVDDCSAWGRAMKKPKPLATRLRMVSAMLRRDRESFISAERWPGRDLDDEAKEIVAEYDAAIQAVKDAITLSKETR